MRRFAGFAALVAAGCAPATPDQPTWVRDVEPIMTANCTRCHGDPALGGAPTTFRLDVFDETHRGSLKIYGANDMAGFMKIRASDLGDMPPYGPTLSDRQREVIARWAEHHDHGTRDDNAPPVVSLVSPTGALTADASLALDVLVTDADHDPITGDLAYDSTKIAPLRNGDQHLVWDTSVVPPGSYRLRAVMVSDGLVSVDQELGVVAVDHGNNGTAPSFTFVSPVADAIVGIGGAATVQWRVSDPDVGDIVRVTIDAVEGTNVRPVAKDLVGGTELTWDATMIPAGPSWRLRATAQDSQGHSTIVYSEPFIVSHTTTTDRYTDVKPILDEVCVQCHKVNFNNGPDFRFYADLVKYRGRAWRKMIQGREMPPPSASAFSYIRALTEDERQQLGTWFLAGAPP